MITVGILVMLANDSSKVKTHLKEVSCFCSPLKVRGIPSNSRGSLKNKNLWKNMVVPRLNTNTLLRDNRVSR